MPTEWQEFTIRYHYGSALYIIRYQRTGTPNATPNVINLVDDGQTHEVVIH